MFNVTNHSASCLSCTNPIKGQISSKITKKIDESPKVVAISPSEKTRGIKKVEETVEIYNFRLTSGKFLSLLGFESTDLLLLPAKSDHAVKLIPYTNLYVHCNLFNPIFEGLFCVW